MKCVWVDREELRREYDYTPFELCDDDDCRWCPLIRASSNQQLGQQMQEAWAKQIAEAMKNQLLASIPPGTVHEFKQDDLYCRCHGLTREELGAPNSPGLRFWVPTPPLEIPVAEPPSEEPTPIPQRKRRKCYVCGAPDACARRADEPAYCEEHRARK